VGYSGRKRSAEELRQKEKKTPLREGASSGGAGGSRKSIKSLRSKGRGAREGVEKKRGWEFYTRDETGTENSLE